MHSYRYMTSSYRADDTQQHRHLPLSNDPLFFSSPLQGPAACVRRATQGFCSQQGMGLGLELAAPTTLRSKRLGRICLSCCCLWTPRTSITQTLDDSDGYPRDTLY